MLVREMVSLGTSAVMDVYSYWRFHWSQAEHPSQMSSPKQALSITSPGLNLLIYGAVIVD